jgi:hypothetical protein
MGLWARVRRNVTTVLVVGMTGWGTQGASGQAEAPALEPVIGPKIDEATMTRASATGEALLAKTK